MAMAADSTRRDFFARTCDGLFGAALASLLNADFAAADSRPESIPAESPESGPANLHPRRPHHSPRATSVIQLFMNGGPSQMDLFDPKPVLDRMDGQPFPGNVEEIGNQGTDDIGVMMGGRYPFERHGESGLWMADILPHTASMADDICLI
ncbi:MAG: DUF1501 domain-containing protein, partial [Planctomycetaceae bacterium]|nr:DUF1501 domain-containing protein [Planctomycetaceae bacterium]